MKETAMPTIMTTSSPAVTAAACLISSRSDTPNMTGMARKNENSAAALLLVPSRMEPRIVLPEREVPGTTARLWKHPMKKAVFASMAPTVFMRGFFLLFSMTMNRTP